MPPATRQRAVAQPVTSPSIDFAPLSSVDVEDMLAAAEQSSDSTPTLRRSTRRATLLARAARVIQQSKVAVEQPQAGLSQRSALKSAAGMTRRSTALTPALPPKAALATRSRLNGTVSSAVRLRQSAGKENAGNVQLVGGNKQSAALTAASKPMTTEVRRSSRVSLITTMTAAETVGRTRQQRKQAATAVPNMATLPVATAATTTLPELINVHAATEVITVPSLAKAAPVLTTCDSAAPLPTAVPVPSAPPPTATSSPTAHIVTLPQAFTVSSSLSIARLRLRPIQAVQLLSPVRPAPLSARARTHGRPLPTQRRRSASVRRESMLGDAATIVWQVSTPPTDEVRAIVRREDEKRKAKAEREEERERAKEVERQREEAEAEKRRQSMARLQETAIVETRRRLRLSQPAQQLTQAAAIPAAPSQAEVAGTEEQVVQSAVAVEVAVADEQRPRVADVEVEDEDASFDEPRASCSLRALVSASVSVALTAAIVVVLLYPVEVDAWLGQ